VPCWHEFRNINTYSATILRTEVLWRACNFTAFIHSSTGPVVHPFASHHEGPGFIPRVVLTWNRDSPVSVVSLHWWPWRDWSLWPRLRRTSSRTVTRPLCWQCDNPTCTVFCPSFMLAAGPSSDFTTDIVGCWGGALWRACNLIAFINSSTGLVVHPSASPHEGPGFNPQGGYLNETGILLLASSGYTILFVRVWRAKTLCWKGLQEHKLHLVKGFRTRHSINKGFRITSTLLTRFS
jgi:hypothetical protein